MFEFAEITKKETYRKEYLGKKILVTDENGKTVKKKIKEDANGFYVMVGKIRKSLRKNDSFSG